VTSEPILIATATIMLPGAWLIKTRSQGKSLLSIVAESGATAIMLCAFAWLATFRALEMLPTMWKAEFDDCVRRHK
jgi:hypothetical protein